MLSKVQPVWFETGSGIDCCQRYFLSCMLLASAREYISPGKILYDHITPALISANIIFTIGRKMKNGVESVCNSCSWFIYYVSPVHHILFQCSGKHKRQIWPDFKTQAVWNYAENFNNKRVIIKAVSCPTLTDAAKLTGESGRWQSSTTSVHLHSYEVQAETHLGRRSQNLI